MGLERGGWGWWVEGEGCVRAGGWVERGGWVDRGWWVREGRGG